MKRKYIYAILLLLFFGGKAQAQFTLVSATVTDTNGIAWSCATVTASVVNNNGQSLYLSGVQFSPAPSSTKLGCPTDPSTSRTPGAFTVQLADNTQIKCGSGASIVTCANQTQWLFLVNTLGIPPPAGTGPQTCTTTVTISGSSQSITAAFTSCPALSGPSTSTGGAGFLPGCNVTQSTCLGTATTPAIPDWKTLSDGTCTNGSNAISWGTPNEIIATDPGKTIDIQSSTVWAQTGKVTIATVNQVAQTGTLSTTIPGPCGIGNMIFDIYTDNAAAFNSTELAIHNSAAHKGIIWYPCGIYGAATAFWNQSTVNDAISYWGGGGGHANSGFGQCAVIKISPAIFAAVSGTGNTALLPSSGDMRDVVLDGEGIITTATNAGLINWNGVMGVSNFQAVNFIGTAGNNPNLCHINSDNFTGVNLSCNFRDGKGMVCNSLNANVFNPQFAGAPGLELADCYGNFTDGSIGTLTTAGSPAITSLSGSGAVMTNFKGTQILGTSSSPGIISITKPSSAPVQVNFIGVSFNCGHIGTPATLFNVGSGAIVQLSGLGNSNALGTTGCLGTNTVANAGTFIDGGANGFGAAGMSMAWSGGGVFQMNCNSWQVAPTISSGFGTSPSVPSGVNPCTFRVNVGAGGVATSGVISFTQAAPNGWNCPGITDATTNTVTRQTAFSTTTATLTAAAAWGANDILILHCDPF